MRINLKNTFSQLTYIMSDRIVKWDRKKVIDYKSGLVIDERG